MIGRGLGLGNLNILRGLEDPRKVKKSKHNDHHNQRQEGGRNTLHYSFRRKWIHRIVGVVSRDDHPDSLLDL